MNKWIVFCVFSLFIGCKNFDDAVPTEKELLNKELKQINWTEVDQYPSIDDCEMLTNQTQKKQCFFEFLTTTIQEKLSVDTLRVWYPNLDTIQVKVTIFPDARLQFEPQFIKNTTAYDTLKIDSIIKTKLVDLPKINPAIKRGIPVKTQFVLPVIIKINK